MKLTNDEKYTAYCIMLEESYLLDDSDGCYWCYVFNMTFGGLVKHLDLILPELYALKTTNNSFVWFNNKRERVAAIEQCIAETALESYASLLAANGHKIGETVLLKLK